MAMFIRVKRKKTTYFLHCEPTETILEIKQKVQALSDNPVDCQRLILINTQSIMEDSKTLADQKTCEPNGLEGSETSEEDQTHQGLEGVILEDARTLAEQQVENDSIVALCLKISDPRVHRIPTLMRHPMTRTPIPTPPPEVVEEIPLESGEEPPSPAPPEHRMSTELRVPYRPPKEEEDSELGDKEGSLGGISSKKDGSQKDTVKDMQKEGGTKEVLKIEIVKKDPIKKDVLKKGGEKKLGKETPGKGGEKKSGKETPGKRGKGTLKKGSKKAFKEEDPPPAEEVVGPLEEGVWEDIIIDKLADYSSLVDSD